MLSSLKCFVNNKEVPYTELKVGDHARFVDTTEDIDDFRDGQWRRIKCATMGGAFITQTYKATDKSGSLESMMNKLLHNGYSLNYTVDQSTKLFVVTATKSAYVTEVMHHDLKIAMKGLIARL